MYTYKWDRLCQALFPHLLLTIPVIIESSLPFDSESVSTSVTLLGQSKPNIAVHVVSGSIGVHQVNVLLVYTCNYYCFTAQVSIQIRLYLLKFHSPWRTQSKYMQDNWIGCYPLQCHKHWQHCMYQLVVLEQSQIHWRHSFHYGSLAKSIFRKYCLIWIQERNRRPTTQWWSDRWHQHCCVKVWHLHPVHHMCLRGEKMNILRLT